PSARDPDAAHRHRGAPERAERSRAAVHESVEGIFVGWAKSPAHPSPRGQPRECDLAHADRPRNARLPTLRLPLYHGVPPQPPTTPTRPREEPMRRAIRMLILLACAALAAAPASAQQPYPTRPVRIVVAFPAGGATDVITRAVSQRLGEMWGQPI